MDFTTVRENKVRFSDYFFLSSISKFHISDVMRFSVQKNTKDSADVVADLRVLLWESMEKGTEWYIGIGCFDLAFCFLPRISSPITSHHVVASPTTPNGSIARLIDGPVPAVITN